MFEFKLPDLGEGIQEAEVLQVKVKEGEQVKEDQPIFEVETDKAVVEIPSPVAGVVEKLHVQAGQVVIVGSVMVSFNTGSTEKAEKSEQVKTKAREEKTVAHGEKKAASSVSAPVMAPEAPGNGRGQVQERIGPVPAAPATRNLARELGVDLRSVRGTGPAGRVLNEDVRRFAAGSLEGTISGAAPKHTGTHPEVEPSLTAKYGESGGKVSGSLQGSGGMSPQPAELPDFSKFGKVERVALKSIRRKIAQNMAQSWSHIPHVTHFDEADVTDLESMRAQNEADVQSQGGRLTLTVFALKAIASGLKKYPQFNASLDERSGELVFKHYYNIGVAVATDRGLIVPVIRNVDQKSVIELCKELSEIAEKTRAGKVELERLQGGTFTLTNIGAIGGTSMVPMINYPECAILGMARAAQKPVVRQGKIEIRLIMPLALSFDHRIADGAEAAYFVQHIVKRLQNPLTFLLEV